MKPTDGPWTKEEVEAFTNDLREAALENMKKHGTIGESSVAFVLYNINGAKRYLPITNPSLGPEIVRAAAKQLGAVAVMVVAEGYGISGNNKDDLDRKWNKEGGAINSPDRFENLIFTLDTHNGSLCWLYEVKRRVPNDDSTEVIFIELMGGKPSNNVDGGMSRMLGVLS